MIANSNQESTAKFVIPRWLDYSGALASGELSLSGEILIPPSKNFDADYKEFLKNPSSGLASDLLGKAFLEDRPEKAELAKFIVSDRNIAILSKTLAYKILSPIKGEVLSNTSKSLPQQISMLRDSLCDQPRNPTKWVDLSRIYTALGLDKKALRCLRIALSISPEDRFTIRAFCRYCIHTDSAEEALSFVRKNRSLLNDPWILATAESLSKILNVASPLPKFVSTEIINPQHSFHHSELREAFAMAELIHGKERKAKRAFRAAWEFPSQNVVRHAEWVTRNTLPALRHETEPKFNESHEASARAAFKEGHFADALRHCELWRFEEPYSTEPLAFESFVLCVVEQFEQVVNCFNKAKERKLVSFTLFNNFLFSTLMQGESDLGEKLLGVSASNTGTEHAHLIKANQGLLALTRGESKLAKSYYEKAEILSKEVGASNADRVFLHYCRSFLKFGYTLNEEEKVRIGKIKKVRLDADFRMLIQFIEKELQFLDEA